MANKLSKIELYEFYIAGRNYNAIRNDADVPSIARFAQICQLPRVTFARVAYIWQHGTIKDVDDIRTGARAVRTIYEQLKAKKATKATRKRTAKKG